MSALLLPTDPHDALKEAVAAAAKLLGEGELVALPTETVYGLGADALRPEAVAKIFEAKERPSFDPLIVHLPTVSDLPRVAVVPEGLEKLIRQLTTRFWPGPLTILLPRTDAVPDLVTAGLPNVAVRVSAHPVFRKIIQTFGNPIAAPSANRFGSLSPTSASAVAVELGDRIPLIVDGGACAHGLESTIIAPELPEREGGKPILRLLRPGPILPSDLKLVGKVLAGEDARRDTDTAPEAPGRLSSHYAPKTPLRLLEKPDDFAPEAGRRYGLLSYRGLDNDGYLGLADWAFMEVLSPKKGKLPEAAVRFFHSLRQLDQAGLDEIIAEPIPERLLGVALMDRLRRAAAAR